MTNLRKILTALVGTILKKNCLRLQLTAFGRSFKIIQLNANLFEKRQPDCRGIEEKLLKCGTQKRNKFVSFVD